MSITAKGSPKPAVSRLGLIGRLKEYAELVKFEHTVFALPFTLSAMLLACPPGMWPDGLTVLWIILAMVGGRTYAMALNRILDAGYDAQNPRTQNRALAAGRLRRSEAWGLVILAAGLFIGATIPLPALCLKLLPAAFLVLTLYSFTKHFTSLCHLVLGVALGCATVGGWLAVTGQLNMLPVLLGWAVVCWVAGFDILYACQDIAVDRTLGLHSIPAWLGPERALWLSRLSHGLAVLFLVLFGLLFSPLQQGIFVGWGFWAATAMMAVMLVYEHRLVSAQDLSNVNEAFFSMNGKISLLFFGFMVLKKIVYLLFWGH